MGIRLTVEEELRIERQQNLALRVRIIELEEAIIELAEVVTIDEGEIENG